MQFRVLGPLDVREGDRTTEVTAPKQRALLLLLLLHGGSVVSTDVMLDALWPDELPATGIKTVRFHISKLRKALAAGSADSSRSVIETRGNGYTIDVDRHDVDARRFEAVAATGRAELDDRPDRAQRLLSEALSLWRGRAYEDVAYEDFAATESRRLEELRLAATEHRIMAELRLGRSAGLVAELEVLVADHPERERPTELLMQALYAAGRSADAIAVGRALRERLAQIGLEPKPSLTEIEDQILRHDAGIPGPAPATVATRVTAPRLPRPLTSFIGRTVEIHDVKTLISGGRLVTLVGSPGSGKTRLALEVARDLDASYRDGATMVELSDVADPALVPQAVGTALGISAPAGADFTELIVGTLRDTESLVVLDNCEHVVGNAARLVLSILQACPLVKVLATSREALGVPGERVWPVPPFALPAPCAKPTEQLLAIDSIRLFVDRAREVNPGFMVDESTIDDVATICRRLDALPLAIELAASTVEALTPHQIAERLSQRFVEVPSGHRPGLAHQATMEDAVRWSYQLLGPTDQIVFVRLSVFAGGFFMDAAEAVAGWGEVDRTEVFDSVLRLVHKSLLVPVPNVQNQVRYRMLTVLRQFGHRTLRSREETAEIDRRHADHYAAVAAAIAPLLQGSQEANGRDLADFELDNFRHALESSLSDGRPETAMELTASLTWYWYWRSYVTEGLNWARRALAAGSDTSPEHRARVLYAVGIFENIAGNYDAAAEGFGQALHLARTGEMRELGAASLTGLGVVLRDRGQLADALGNFEQAIAIDRAIGDHGHLALALRFAASVNLMLGRVSDARTQADESYRLFEDLGHRGGMGWALETTSRIAFRTGAGDGFDLANRARRLFAEVHDRRNDAWVLLRMAESHLESGWLAEARAETDQALAIFTELNDKRGIGYAVMCAGLVELADRRFDEAGADLRRGLQLFLDLGDDGGASTVCGFLAALAIRQADVDGAIGHAQQWLSLPGSDRYVWSFLDVITVLAATAHEAGYDAAELENRRTTFAATLRQEGDGEAAEKALDDIPRVLAMILGTPPRAGS